MMNLETKEPISITAEYDANFETLDIYVDGIHYAELEVVEEFPNKASLANLIYWIEETYYDGCYKSDQYTPCRLSFNSFKA